MIIIAAYGDTIPNVSPEKSPLETLRTFVNKIAPSGMALHLLPFYPSDGDGGFAPSDWFSVDPKLGRVPDLVGLAHDRPLIIDGIYNHVGRNHPFVKSDFSRPTTARYLYIEPDCNPADYPDAPRGGSVMRPHWIRGQRWHCWQTFTADAFDINLRHPEVRQEVKRHIQWARTLGVWGLRLDAPAYYGKVRGTEHRHSNESVDLSRAIVGDVLETGLAAVAQLDCEERCLQYFSASQVPPLALIDFSYPAHVVAAWLRFNAADLAEHLRRTWNTPHPLVRYPRSHDGIYLRSELTPEIVRSKVAAAAEEAQSPVRAVDGRIYEINLSLPELLRIGVSQEDMYARLFATVCLTTVVPGWAYLYLPALLGYIAPRLAGGDPRTANRLPVVEAFVKGELASSGWLAQLSRVLPLLLQVKKDLPTCGQVSDTVRTLGDCLVIERLATNGVGLAINLHPTKSATVRPPSRHHVITSLRYKRGSLGPLGTMMWARDP